MQTFQEGEMVYKIITRLDIKKAQHTFRLYDAFMSPQKIVKLLLSTYSDLEAMALHRATNDIYRISTVMLGYIYSPREEGVPFYPPSTPPLGQEGVSNDNNLIGYRIRWERNDSNETYVNFEDETRLIGLKDIIILSPEELRNNILSR